MPSRYFLKTGSKNPVESRAKPVFQSLIPAKTDDEIDQLEIDFFWSAMLHPSDNEDFPSPRFSQWECELLLEMYGWETGYYGFCTVQDISLPSVVDWYERYPEYTLRRDDSSFDEEDRWFVGLDTKDPRSESVVPDVTFRGKPITHRDLASF